MIKKNLFRQDKKKPSAMVHYPIIKQYLQKLWLLQKILDLASFHVKPNLRIKGILPNFI